MHHMGMGMGMGLGLPLMVSHPLLVSLCVHTSHGLYLAPFLEGTPAFMGWRKENTCERLRRMRGLGPPLLICSAIQFWEG